MTLSLLTAADEVPNRTALVADGVRFDFAGLAARVRGALERLRRAPAGITPLVGESSLDGLVELYALVELERPVLLLHPRSTVHERRRWTELLGGGNRLPCETGDADERPLAIVPTSGTGGRPKAVVLSRRAFVAAAGASAANLGWQEDDRWLLSLPLAHVGGLSIVTRCLAARRTVVVESLERFDAEAVVRVVEERRITLLSVVPTMLRRLLRRSPAWSPPPELRAILVGGAAASQALLTQSADRGWPVLTTYGLTEACSQVATQRPGTVNRGDLGSGLPLAGMEVRIRGGAIEIRGPQMMTGYLPGDPSVFTADGWLVTGDLGRLDERGHLHVLGRRDEVIVTGGENVHPREVEEALECHPSVDAAFVAGRPDDEWGQAVVALIVPSGDSVDVEALRQHCRRRLSRFKVPRRFEIVEELPMTSSGKRKRRMQG